MNKLPALLSSLAEWPREPYLLAVSGGPDSMCLAALFWQAQLPFALAHVNYGLRGEASDADEALVKQWANERNIPCFVEHAHVAAYQHTHGFGLQEAARDIRYQFFHRLTAETPFKQLVTAHQRNDQDETMLLHFFRGTGLRGLRGIPSGEINGLRPLLDIERNEIIDWLAQNEVPYRIDESNATSKYTRNALRNEVIPFLKDYFPNLETVLAENRQRFKSSYAVMQREINRWQAACTAWRPPHRYFFIRSFINDPEAPLYLYETLREFGFQYAQIHEVMLLATRQSGAYIESASHRIIKDRKTLILSAKELLEANWVPCAESDTRVDTPNGSWTIRRMPYHGEAIPTSGNAFWFDAQALEFPLWFRPKKTGDYFYPLGLGKKKKIARLLIDTKMALPDKEQVWVLQSGERLAWVIGIRQDDRFKVTPQTREVLIFTATN
jgi:tRNA(Ile)-lysidine synthase